MSDLVMVALIAALPPTLTTLLSMRRVRQDAAVIKEEVKVADAKINGKLDHVTSIANSRLTETLDKVESLTKEVALLRAHVTQTLPAGQTSEDVVPDPEKKK